jgi:hypothetical protein
MLLLIRHKKAVPVRRRKPIVPAIKRIGAFARQIFMALFGLAMSLGLVMKEARHEHTSKSGYNVLMAALHNASVLVESMVLILLVFTFLFVRDREEH